MSSPATRDHPIPVEILANICNSLSISRKEGLVGNTPNTSALAATQALHAVTLTSRRLYCIAQPLLYETVVLDKPDSHQKLFRALRINPTLSLCVRTIIFFEPIANHPPRDIDGRIYSLAHATEEERMAKDGEKLWKAVTKYDRDTAARYDTGAAETRDAVIDFVLLLTRLPNLKMLRYIGLERESMFRQILQTVAKILETPEVADISSRIVPAVQEMSVSGLATEVWAPLVLDELENRDLRRLELSFPMIHGTVMRRFQMSNFAFHCIKDLRISSLVFTPLDLSLVIPNMQCLEVFYYEWGPSLKKTKENEFKHLISAVESQKENIKELHISINERAWAALTPTLQPTEAIPPWSFTAFPRLRVLEVPDIILFDVPFVLRARIPPNIETLVIMAWFEKKELAKMLADLALGAARVPTLKRVVVQDKVTELPLLWGLVQEAKEIFQEKGVLFEHSWA
ncbi:hypothetical protein BDV18DRAFT_161003 [Aspergillus unguis]